MQGCRDRGRERGVPGHSLFWAHRLAEVLHGAVLRSGFLHIGIRLDLRCPHRVLHGDTPCVRGEPAPARGCHRERELSLHERLQRRERLRVGLRSEPRRVGHGLRDVREHDVADGGERRRYGRVLRERVGVERNHQNRRGCEFAGERLYEVDGSAFQLLAEFLGSAQMSSQLEMMIAPT